MSNCFFDFIKGYTGSLNDSTVEIIGSKSVIIENVKSIIEYEKDILRVSLGKRNIVVDGKNLKITDYIENNIVVVGDIEGVRLE